MRRKDDEDVHTGQVPLTGSKDPICSSAPPQPPPLEGGEKEAKEAGPSRAGPSSCPQTNPPAPEQPSGRTRRSGSRSGSERSKRRPSREAGAPPWDMESLKAAILKCKEGAGEVEKCIRGCTFSPRPPAFTALINLCGKERLPNKALEVFDASQHVPGVRKNTYMYSALISALGVCGMWEKAWETFEEMGKEAKTDPECTPNTITYSSLISSCERVGRLDKAWEVYHLMKTNGVRPDLITYSVLLTACEKQSEWDKALEIVEAMHAEGLVAAPLSYSRLIHALGERGDPSKATEIFLGMQVGGGEPTVMVCNSMMHCLDLASSGDNAYHLLRSMHAQGLVGETITYNLALSALLKLPNMRLAEQKMLDVYYSMKYFGVQVTDETGSLLLQMCEKCNDTQTAIALTHELRQMNVAMDQTSIDILSNLMNRT